MSTGGGEQGQRMGKNDATSCKCLSHKDLNVIYTKIGLIMVRNRNKTKHIHKYELVDIGINRIINTYRCADSDCTHYMPQHLLKRTLLSRCWSCDGIMEIDTKENTRMHPWCQECSDISETRIPIEDESKPRTSKSPEEIEAFIRSLGFDEK